MLEILKFIFSSFWVWVGSIVMLVLILATCGTVLQAVVAIVRRGEGK